MDNDYICERLLKLSTLLYGKKSRPYAKYKNGIYIFGSRKQKIKNIVSKQIAMYLIINKYDKD